MITVITKDNNLRKYLENISFLFTNAPIFFLNLALFLREDEHLKLPEEYIFYSFTHFASNNFVISLKIADSTSQKIQGEIDSKKIAASLSEAMKGSIFIDEVFGNLFSNDPSIKTIKSDQFWCTDPISIRKAERLYSKNIKEDTGFSDLAEKTRTLLDSYQMKTKLGEIKKKIGVFPDDYSDFSRENYADLFLALGALINTPKPETIRFLIKKNLKADMLLTMTGVLMSYQKKDNPLSSRAPEILESLLLQEKEDGIRDGAIRHEKAFNEEGRQLLNSITNSFSMKEAMDNSNAKVAKRAAI